MPIYRTLSVRSGLIILLCVYSLVLLAGFVIIGNSQYFDWKTALLGVCLSGMLAVSLKYSSTDAQYAHISMLTVLFFFHVFSRILSYLFVPGMVVFPFGSNIDAGVINRGLSYVLLGTASAIAGIFAAGLVFRRQPTGSATEEKFISVPFGVLMFGFIAVAALELVIFYGLGISLYDKWRPASYNTLLQLIKASFALDAAFFVVCLLFLMGKERPSMAQFLGIAMVSCFFLVVSILFGKRGIAFNMLVIFLAICLAKYKSFSLPVLKPASAIKSIVAAILVIAISYVSVYYGTSARRNIVTRGYTDTTVHDSTPAAGGVAAAIVNRIGVVDYAILVVTQPGDGSKYMNPKYILKSIVNTLPGTPFPEAELSTSRVMNIIYRGRSEDYVLNVGGYFSEIWTIWGATYAVFGWWKGLLALFMTGFGVQIANSFLAKHSGAYYKYYNAWFLLYIPPIVYFNSGIDHMAVAILIMAIQTVVMLLFLKAASTGANRFKLSTAKGIAKIDEAGRQ